MTGLADAVRGAVASAIGGAPPGASLASPSLPGASAALVALALARIHGGRDIFVVAPGGRECELVFSDIRAFDSRPEQEPLLLPPRGGGAGDDADRDGMRLAFARALASDRAPGAGRIFIVAAPDLSESIPDPDAVEAAGLRRAAGKPSPVPVGLLAPRLMEMGYRRAPETVEKCAFSVRGGLIDIWPPTAPLPLRVDFFGDDIESIHPFEPATQRSRPDAAGEAWIPQCALDVLPGVVPVEKAREGSVFLWLEHDAIAASLARADDGKAATFASLRAA
ncbi:MAG: hypothetical protein IJP66_08890, partial [Kiritimatiellae bacterium]|nr:hypothetical protein [Kiritimatiellia bacterium]